MRKFNMLLLMLVFCLYPAISIADEPVGVFLQKISVNVSAKTSSYGGVQGSGTLFLSKVGNDNRVFVLTAYHVVSGLKRTREVITEDGNKKIHVRFDDAVLMQEQLEDGRVVGKIEYDCKVICVDEARDVALLMVRKKDCSKYGGKLYLDDKIPVPGTLIYHCGAPGGANVGGSASLTPGIISRIGVKIPEYGGSEKGIFDQAVCDSLPGSSGGLVALQSDGRIVGIITLGLRGNGRFSWMVPARSIKEWAKQAHIMWLFDPKLPRPTEKDLSKVPLIVGKPGFDKHYNSVSNNKSQEIIRLIK